MCWTQPDSEASQVNKAATKEACWSVQHLEFVLGQLKEFLKEEEGAKQMDDRKKNRGCQPFVDLIAY